MGPLNQGAGLSVVASQFVGARFSLATGATVSDVGAHLAGFGTFFFGVVSLSGPGAFPSGNPFDGTLLATTTFTAPTLASSDVSVPLSIVLPPGEYAIVMGTGLFGTSGAGALVTNNVSHGASYLTWTNNTWNNCCNVDAIPRLVVYGTANAVPEPATLALVGLGLLGAATLRRKSRR